ncbi:MAG: NAD(P)-binding domain-containing protein [Syntrophomonadaceae bacterium]|nr:NAD(P)-binding domain-containing protein [Syntrophomonadaceae bacterium]
MKTVAIIGAGNSGLAMAAHLAIEGNLVHLWNRRSPTITPLLESPFIKVDGVINGDAKLKLVSSDMQEVVEGASIVLVTTPANAHAEIARVLAPYATAEMLIVLNPGRTFGALEFSAKLKEYGCVSNPLVIETQTIIYTCRKIHANQVSIMAFKHDVFYSAIDHKLNHKIMERFPECLRPFFIPAPSMIETSIGNVGMILHCAPVLLNSGWIESPYTQFKYYYEGITPSVARFLEKLDRERLEVASLLGHPVESTAAWMRRSYEVEGKNLYACIQNNLAYQTIDAPTTLQHRYILEDVSCGLVPLEAVGRSLGLPMQMCGLIIDLANAMLEMDFRKSGRAIDIRSIQGEI